MNRSDHIQRYRPVRKRGERGSALLIVFVLAASIAIMLYMELPVAVFEAQRQKEQLLIDRGNEYAHAVKLFVRKIGTYPTSIDALEKTNNMRFLRHRFKDPFTGKDDWRILHAGPNGMLIDSKVKQTGLGQGANGANTQNAFSGLSSTTPSSSSPFGSSAFGTSTNNAAGANNSGSASNADSTPPEVMVKPVPQRPPEMAANGSQAVKSAADQDPLAPLLPPGQAEANQAADTSGIAPLNSGEPASPGQNGTAPAGGAAGSPTTGTSGTGSGSSGMGSFGVIASGSIAGVASKAGGHSIKVVNDQTDYSLWEFYYDPTKDATKGMANALSSMGAAQQGNQQQNGIGTSSPFSNNNSSPFSNNNSSSGMTSPFGSSNNTPPSNPTPQANTPPSSISPQQSPNQ